MWHYGIRARERVFWPGILNDIKTLAETFTVCKENSESHPEETQQQTEVPLHVWEILGIDLLELNKEHFLLVVGWLRQFPSLEKTQQSKHSHNSTTLETNILRIWHPNDCSDRWKTTIQHRVSRLQDSGVFNT